MQFSQKDTIFAAASETTHTNQRVKEVGRSIALAIWPVRKVRTGKGTLLRKAQMGVIF